MPTTPWSKRIGVFLCVPTDEARGSLRRGGVAAFDETGELAWRERRAALPPIALPRDPELTPLYAYASADHFLRLIAPQQ